MNELVLFINSLMRDSTINPFRYVSSTSSRILSGEEEGVFEWITVNYLLGSFGRSASRTHSLFHRSTFAMYEATRGGVCIYSKYSLNRIEIVRIE